MPDDKIIDSEEQAKLNSRIEEFNKRELQFERKRLIDAGYNKDVANSMNSLESLKILYDAQIKHNCAVAKKEEEEKEKKKNLEAQVIKKNTAGIPSVTFPNGDEVEADPIGDRNVTNREARLIDPTSVPLTFHKIRSNARPNLLPPTKEFPYERMV